MITVSHFVNPLALALIPGLAGIAVFAWWYARYLGIRFGTGTVLALAGEAAAFLGAWGTEPRGLERGLRVSEQLLGYRSGWFAYSVEWRLVIGTAYVTGVMLALGLAAKVYLAVMTDRITAEERLPNGKGIRAWLSPMGWVTVAGIVLGACLGMGWPVWQTAAGAFGLLLAYPIVNCILHGGQRAQPQDTEDLTEERRRVLTLVETGKISGEDGAELIGTLGQSRASAPEDRGSFSAGKRLMLLGAMVVLVGFCLPWFEVNVGVLQREAMKALHMLPESPSQIPNIPGGMNFAIPGSGREAPLALGYGPNGIQDIFVTVRGGDLQYALGWFILGLVIAAALLPVLWPANARNRVVQRGISLAALVAGSVILIYVATTVMGTGAAVRMALGMFLAILGYVVLWAGALREYIPITRSSGPAMVPAAAARS